MSSNSGLCWGGGRVAFRGKDGSGSEVAILGAGRMEVPNEEGKVTSPPALSWMRRSTDSFWGNVIRRWKNSDDSSSGAVAVPVLGVVFSGG